MQRVQYRGRERDEELAPVGVGPRVGHADGVGPVVLQLRPELVPELAAPDALAARARAWGRGTGHITNGNYLTLVRRAGSRGGPASILRGSVLIMYVLIMYGPLLCLV